MISKLSHILFAALTASVVGAAGCSTLPSNYALRCDVTLDSISPTNASPGDSVVVTGGPFTSTYDSAVYVGESRAVVDDVDRSSCYECDSCQAENNCSVCGDCDVCDAVCATTCIEALTFVVPDLPTGTYAVQLFNGHGQSNAATLSVQGTSTSESNPTDDTGAQDDTGTTGDTGASPIFLLSNGLKR